MLKEVRIVTVEELTNSKFIKPQKISYTIGEDPAIKEWEIAPAMDSVHCVIYDKDTDEFVTVQQVRISVLHRDDSNKGIVNENCAGLLDNPALSPQETMVKEIKEELGYEVDPNNLFITGIYKTGVGSNGATAHYFLTVIGKDTPKGETDFGSSEDIVERRTHMSNILEIIFEENNWEAGSAGAIKDYMLYKAMEALENINNYNKELLKQEEEGKKIVNQMIGDLKDVKEAALVSEDKLKEVLTRIEGQ